MEKQECISCKTDISNIKGSVIFSCPNCGKVKIIRCGKCKQLAIPYKCPECKFEGP